jgi:hypothetical protein
VGGSDLASDDDGGEGSNSLLAYVAQADESLQVIVDGWSDPSGEFTLNVEVIDPTNVEVGGTVNLAPEGHPNVYTVFSELTQHNPSKTASAFKSFSSGKTGR